MSKEEFKILFDQALEAAAQNAEQKLGSPVPRQFVIELHGLALHSRMLARDSALEQVYIDPKQFYQIIDVSIRRVSKDISTVSMVISGHTPVPLSQTWNQPPGSGPFKQVLANEVEAI